MRNKNRGTELVGRRFGKQVVTRALGGAKVEIQCDCGTIKATPFQYLLNGQSRSCGCGRYADRLPPLEIGQVFERLTIIQKLGTNGRKREVLCDCSCGKRKVVNEGDLRSGTVKSCGCFRSDRMSGRAGHGEAGLGTRSSLYQAWVAMRTRIRRPDKWPTYVGLTIHPEWNAYEAFRDYVNEVLGPRPEGHSLDRIDNNVGYLPGNIRWSSASEQAFNRGKTGILTVGDVTKTLREWAESSGLPQHVIRNRHRAGWPTELAVTLPVRGRSAD